MDLAFSNTLRRADGALDVPGAGAGAGEPAEAFKRFLKIETERLRTRHRFGLGGREIATGRSDLVDVGECVAMARDDLHSRTALSEARVVTGSGTLFARLIAQMDALVFGSARATESFLESLRFDLGERYERFGRAVGLQEPHVKESAGGLRDLHVVLWVGHALFGARGLAALHDEGRISDRERRSALRAYDQLH